MSGEIETRILIAKDGTEYPWTPELAKRPDMREKHWYDNPIEIDPIFDIDYVIYEDKKEQAEEVISKKIPTAVELSKLKKKQLHELMVNVLDYDPKARQLSYDTSLKYVKSRIRNPEYVERYHRYIASLAKR